MQIILFIFALSIQPLLVLAGNLDIEEKILGKGIVVVYFCNKQHDSCLELESTMDELSKLMLVASFSKFRLVKIDIDENPSLFEKYAFEKEIVPQLVVFQDGKRHEYRKKDATDLALIKRIFGKSLNFYKDELANINFLLEKWKQGSPLKILYFWAEWCANCKQITPLVDKAKKILASRGVTIEKVHFDKNKKLVEKYNISGPPMFTVIVQETNESYNLPSLFINKFFQDLMEN